MERLRALLRWGYKNDLIDDISYLAKLEDFKDKPHRAKIQDKYLEQAEAEHLLKNMKSEKWRDLTRFQILSGLRIGEALALSTKDVYLKARIISVTKNFDVVNKTVKNSPKNSPSIREVYIQDELLPLCKKIKHNALVMKLATGTDAFFQDANGRYEYAAYNCYLKDYSRIYVGRELTTHALRHTHTSLMAEQGVSLEVISRRLGHANSKITKDIYFHVTKSLKEKDFQRVASVNIF